MVETQSNLPQEIPQDGVKSAQPNEREEIDLPPLSVNALNKGTQMENEVLDDEHH